MANTNKTPFILIIFFFLSLFIYTKIAGPITFSVNNVNTENTAPFQATGTGEVKATANQASVSIGVNVNANSSDDAQSQINSIINKVTSDLINLGISPNDIKTSDFQIYPNNSFSPQPAIPLPETGIVAKPQVINYTGSANIEVKAPSVDIANKAIDAATIDGANVVGGVNFTFDDATHKKLEQEARTKAIADAKQKAQDLASAAGIKLGKVINVQESDNGFPIPMAANAKGMGTIPNQTQLNPGESTVSITVTLTFETN